MRQRSMHEYTCPCNRCVHMHECEGLTRVLIRQEMCTSGCSRYASLSLCAYVHECAYVFVCVRVRACRCRTHARMCSWKGAKGLWANVHACAYAHVCVCVCVCVERGGYLDGGIEQDSNCAHTQMHTRTHTRARAHTHTHTHTQNNHHRTEYFIYFTHVYDTDSTRTQNKTKQNPQNGVVYNQSGYHNIQLFSMHYTYTCQ